MDYKEKYEQALERCRKLYNEAKANEYASDIDDYETIFPELVESEDEKILRSLKAVVKEYDMWTERGLSMNDVLTWLEKQAEPIEINPTEFDTRLQNLIGQFDSLPKEELLGSLGFWTNVVQNDGTYKDEKQGKQKPNPCDGCINRKGCINCENGELRETEHKPVDKVEPKFHEGEWIIHQGTENIYQVVAIIDNQYQLKYGGNYTTQYCEDVDRCTRLWDITKDTKDGDVLYLQKDGKEHIIIYKGVIKERFRTFVSAYCAYNGIVDAFCFADVSRYVDIAYRGIMPATKEQRDILFKKMKEAGYEWDSEKKELKKIEQKPAWSEEDERIILAISQLLKDCESENGWNCVYSNDREVFFADMENWLKSIKDRVQPQPKQEWSDIDKNMLFRTISDLEFLRDTISIDPNYVVNIIDLEREISWLKSIRPQNRWKPSEEQMNSLKQAINTFPYETDYLKLLYDDLKKLKKE